MRSSECRSTTTSRSRASPGARRRAEVFTSQTSSREPRGRRAPRRGRRRPAPPLRTARRSCLRRPRRIPLAASRRAWWSPSPEERAASGRFRRAGRRPLRRSPPGRSRRRPRTCSTPRRAPPGLTFPWGSSSGRSAPLNSSPHVARPKAPMRTRWDFPSVRCRGRLKSARRACARCASGRRSGLRAAESARRLGGPTLDGRALG